MRQRHARWPVRFDGARRPPRTSHSIVQAEKPGIATAAFVHTRVGGPGLNRADSQRWCKSGVVFALRLRQLRLERKSQASLDFSYRHDCAT
jgi:hypothetical protein